MRGVVEELVHIKLEKRAPDELSPKPDLYEHRSPEMSIGLDLDWTGSGLPQILLIWDWIRSINHFKILEPDRIWTELMEKIAAFLR